ncbi:hypothetical protein GYA25_02970 [Candidatus Woesearchaeota archaeon]|jgi:hypothetical protein|nr:hypothetical protein [Candidatus Woesearchaeota archaeon]
MEFLWHKISDKEREEIKKQVLSNLDSFSKKLSEIKEEFQESFIVREESYRLEKEEKENEKTSEEELERKKEFKKLILENAPNKNENSIIAEKKKW